MAKTKLDEIQLQVIINGDKAGKTLGDLNQAQKQLSAELKNIKIGSDEWIKKMDELKKVTTQIDGVKKEIKGVGDQMGKAKEMAMNVAGALGLAFGIEKVFEFGKASVEAFMDAEKNAKALEFTLNNISNEGSGALKMLIEQSEELQQTSIFSDDDIQVSQKMLLQLNLTSKQVASLTPQIIDLAAAQGVDLATATDTVVNAINGQTKGLKSAGIILEDTGSKTKNLANIQMELVKFTGAAASEMETASGQSKRLANDFDNLKETVGEFIMGAADGFMILMRKIGAIEESAESLEATLNKGKIEQRKAVNDVISELDEAALKKRIETDKRYLKILTEGRAVAFKDASKEELQAEIDKVQMAIEVEEKGLKQRQATKDDYTAKGKAAAKKVSDEETEDYAELLEAIETLTKRAEKKKVSEREQELEAIDEHYKKYIKKAQKHGDALRKIEELKNQEKIEVNDQYNRLEIRREAAFHKQSERATEKNERELDKIKHKHRKAQHQLDKEYWDKWKNLQDKRIDAAQSVHDSLTVLANIAAEQGEEWVAFSKALAVFQIAINTAKAVSGAIASAQTMPYPYNLIAAASGVAAVIAGIAQAYQILNSEQQPSAPEFAEGGPMTHPSSKAGGWRDKPFLAWTGEEGVEWTAPNWMIEHPKLIPTFTMLEDIRQSKSFAAGGPMTSNVTSSTPSFTNKTSTAASNADLAAEVRRLNNILEKGIYGIWDWDYFQKSTAKIASAKNSATIGNIG